MLARHLGEKEVESSWRSHARGFQADTVELMLAALFVATNVLLVHTPGSEIDLNREKALGGMLWLLVVLTWFLLRRSYSGAVWLLVLGLGGIAFLFAHWYPAGVALLALPVMLAVGLLGGWQGLLVGLAVSLVLVWRLQQGPTDPIGSDTLIALGLGSTWAGAGLTWAVLRPLHTLLAWSWQYYERAQMLLEQARDRQLELHEVREDLERANRNLARLYQLVIASQKEAEEARRAKEIFVANVSHELRTPLNMIIGFSDLITRVPAVYRKHLPRQLLADVGAIQRNARHLSQLVDDVLDLSKADSDCMSLSMQPCRLRDVCMDAVQAIRALFDAKSLSLEVDVPENLPQVLCDVTRVRQVLLNLLSNAGRVTERGGVRVSAREREGELEVAVADTGPGIPTEDMQHLFEPFRQLERPFHDQSGTGLGLSICKKLIELHGGKVWAESELGVGTTFHFSLPLTQPDEVEASAGRWLSDEWHYRALTRPRRATLPEVRPRVVVVDDDEGTLAALVTQHLGDFEVTVASCMDQAITVLSETPARALIVNERIPGEDRSWQKALQMLPYSLPVATCHVAGGQSASRRLGTFDCLVKPISREQLLKAIESVPHSVDTVLIVDDEPECVQLFARMLESSQRHYSVLRANGGRRAIEIMRTARPDLVLLDLVMPDMDGFQVLAHMRGEPELSDTPVITISARDLLPEPVISDSLTISRPEGLCQSDLLEALETLVQALAPMWRTDGQGPPETPGG